MKKELIKFRGYNHKVKKMFYNIQDTYDGLTEEQSGVDECSLDQDNINAFYSWLYDPNVDVMQHLCKKDINGKDVYAGDIIRLWDVSFPNPYTRHVSSFVGKITLSNELKIKYENMVYEGKKSKKYKTVIKDGEYIYPVEVLGNIYENPELLPNNP